MTETTTTTRFVAEIGVRARFRSSRRKNDRQPLDGAPTWGVRRGYWDPWWPKDREGNERPAGLILTVEFDADDLETAEDRALSLGNRLAQLAAFVTGSPPMPCRLLRLAEVDGAGALLAQWNYFYEESPPPAVTVAPPQMREFLRRVAAADELDRSRFELASRWYAISTGGLTPSDQYLSAWIGLEVIGARLDEYYHPNGPKAPCSTCGNKAGKARDRKEAGIEHLVRRVAPELLSSRSFQDLANLRHEIAHGLRAEPDVTDEVAPLVGDLQLCLGAGALAALDGPSTEPTYGWQAALPRDYEERPDSRVTIRPSRSMPAHRPFEGKWVDLTRELRNERWTVSEGGVVTREARAHLSFAAEVPKGMTKSEITMSFETFNRDGLEFPLTYEGVELESGDWRVRKRTPAWTRVSDLYARMREEDNRR